MIQQQRKHGKKQGVLGRVTTEKLGNYQYRKRGNIYRVNLFLLPVEEILEDWPEATTRQRKIGRAHV